MNLRSPFLLFLIYTHAVAIHLGGHVGTSDYKVAVYEHRPAMVPRGTSPLDLMMANVAFYEQAVQTASKAGVQLIVFPEYGTYSTASYYSRNTLLPFLQIIPSTFTPCQSSLNGSEVILKLSCLARTNTITIVANLGTVDYCSEATEANCPSDGRFQYNTDLVFDGNSGEIIAKYHKFNLFGERNFNHPPLTHVTFSSSFGQIGLGICFDLLSQEPLLTLTANQSTKMIVLPSMWFNRIPFLAMYEIAEAWAVRMQTYLLVANIHSPNTALTGSGIFGPKGVVRYTYVVDPDSAGQLVIAELPKISLKSTTSSITPDFPPVSPIIANDSTFFTRTNGDLFKFTRVATGTNQHLTLCEHKLCCYLNYSLEESTGSGFFALGVFSGLHKENYTLFNEVCAVVRCLDKEYCGDGIARAVSGFKFLHLRVSTTLSTVWFPTVLTDKALLMNSGEWVFRQPGDLLSSNVLSPVLVYALYGRVF